MDALKLSTLAKIDLLGDQFLVEFINDTIEFYLRSKKVSFLSKYAETLQGAHNVIPIREFIIGLIKLSLRKTHMASSLDQYKHTIVENFESHGFSFDGSESMQINPKTVDIISASIFARRTEL